MHRAKCMVFAFYKIRSASCKFVHRLAKEVSGAGTGNRTLGLECRRLLLSVLAKAAEVPDRPREQLPGLGEGGCCIMRGTTPNARALSVLLNLKPYSPSRRTSCWRDLPSMTPRCSTHLSHFRGRRCGKRPCVGAGGHSGGRFPRLLDHDQWGFRRADGWGAAARNTSSESPNGILRNGHRLANGYRWRPLSKEWDYAASSARIRTAP